MRDLIAVLLLIFCGGGAHGSAGSPIEPSTAFRMHQGSEPRLLDPHRLKSASSQFMMQNLHRNLLRLNEKSELVPDLAESCRREKNNLAVICDLKKNLKWSDGTPLTPRDFLNAYLRILNPATAAPRADLLFGIRGAEEFYKTQKGGWGISVSGDRRLRFELTSPQPDFEYELASLILAPFREPTDGKRPQIFSGPYRIQAWEENRRAILTKNEFYPGGSQDRPNVEVLFVEDDGIALKLYEKNQLDFLRRLTTLFIPQYKNSPEFHWIPLLRLDYLGFGPRLRNFPGLREALALSLNYPELQKIFHSEGRPGCPGLPNDWVTSGKMPCYEVELVKAQKRLTSENSQLSPLRMIYSNVGGEDHRRGAEWQQDQWRKNLNLKVSAVGLENKLFLSELANETADIFRRGVSADHPTCRSFLHTFRTGQPEDYLKIKNPKFQKTITDLDGAISMARQKKLCERGLKFLMTNHWFIPTGQMHFAVLAKTTYTGWTFNSLNQLDLSQLERVETPPAPPK